MKRIIKVMMLIAALTFPTIAQAETNIESQIDQLQAEIHAKQAEILELKQLLLEDQDTIQFEHEGLSFTILIEVTPVENQTEYLEDTYVKLHTTVENTTDEAIALNSDWFKMYLVEVPQSGVFGPLDKLENQAIPEKTTVQGVIYFNVTEAVSNSKDLLVRYQPSDTVFEFKVNDYKRLVENDVVPDTGEKAIEKAVEKEPVNNLGYQSGDYIVSDEYTGYVNPQGEAVEGSQEVYDYIEEAYYFDVANQEDYSFSGEVMTPDNLDQWE